MPYRKQIIAPFTGGLNTDTPSWMINERQSVLARDLISYLGLAQQRRGWEYDGTVADVASDLQSVSRTTFVIADVTRTMTTAANGNIYIHNSGSSGTQIFDGTGIYLKRATYRDEDIFCHQDGLTPLIRYSGASVAGPISYTGNAAPTTGEATLTGMTLSSTPVAGSYAHVVPATAIFHLPTWHRILEASTTSVTLEDVRVEVASGSVIPGGSTDVGLAVGWGFPCVSIYNAGTVTYASGAGVTGYGTEWDTGPVDIIAHAYHAEPRSDALLITPTTGNAQLFSISGVVDNDSLNGGGATTTDITTKSSYQLLRRMNFTEACAHQDSLWGTGVALYPNRVYVGPPGWNIAIPPGYQPPFDVMVDWDSENASDYLMNTIDVPSPYDGDVNIALLTSTNPLLCIKRHDCYGIYGTYPTFTTKLIKEGAGCLDIRSAQNLPMGPVWCGENGIYTYQEGRVIDLTAGRINREYTTAVKGFSLDLNDTITTGECESHLFVSLRAGDEASDVEDKTWVFDIKNGVWISNFTNHNANYYFSADVPDEHEEMYWIDANDHQGRVMKSTTIFGNTPGVNERDGDDIKPELIAQSGRNLSGKGPEIETTMLDMSLTARVFDGAGAGSTQMDVYSSSYDALRETHGTFLVGSIDSEDNTTFTLHGVPRRFYFRNVNNRGRLHYFTVDVSTFDFDNDPDGALVAIDTATFSFVDTADRT